MLDVDKRFYLQKYSHWSNSEAAPWKRKLKEKRKASQLKRATGRAFAARRLAESFLSHVSCLNMFAASAQELIQEQRSLCDPGS